MSGRRHTQTDGQTDRQTETIQDLAAPPIGEQRTHTTTAGKPFKTQQNEGFPTHTAMPFTLYLNLTYSLPVRAADAPSL